MVVGFGVCPQGAYGDVNPAGEVGMVKIEDPFFQLTENSPDAIFISTKGRFCYANPAAQGLFGATSAKQLLGESVMARIHPDHHPEVVARLRCLEDMKESVPALEEVYLRLDGTPVAVEVYAVPFRHEDANCVLVYVRDITRRKQAEAEIHALNHSLEQRVAERTRELHAKETLLREALVLNESILMTSPVGIGAYRPDGQCVMANPALAELVGGSREQLLGFNFRQLPSWQVSGLLAVAECVLATGARVEHETLMITSFKREVWVHAQLSRFTTGGEPHLLLMLDDITEEKRAAELLAEREREFRTLADNVPDNIIRYDCACRVLYVNRTLERTLGIAAENMVGKTPEEIAPGGRFRGLQEALMRVAAGGAAEEVEQIATGPDGEPRYHAVSIVPEAGPDGRPVSVLAVGRDLTPQKIAEEELRLAASVFHNSAEGVMVTDGSGNILSVNPAFTEITGYTWAEALGRTPSLLRSDRHGAEFYRALWDALNLRGRWQGEIWNRRKDGEAYLEWLTINRIDDNAGAPVRYVAVFHDVTESRRKDEHIRYLAFHDALTSLPNRTLLQDRLQHAIERARREGTRLAVTFIDLDRFKVINDTLGHDVGDLLLMEVAHRISGRLRASDTVARMGGDEFVVLMEDLHEIDDCASLAQELILEIAQPMDLCGHPVQVGASMGMAFYPEDGTDSVELMKRADRAMYAAKSAGRNTFRYYQGSMG